MPTIAIERHNDAATVSRVTAEMEEVFDQIRHRAHTLFQQRGAAGGRTLDDWLQAEREIVAVPPSELIEKREQFVLQVALPGLTPDKVRVRVMPHAIVIQEDRGGPDRTEAGQVHFSELNRNPIFRCCTMPAEIDVERIETSLENGILRIEAPKRKPPIRAARGKKLKSRAPGPTSKKKAARKKTLQTPPSRRGA